MASGCSDRSDDAPGRSRTSPVIWRIRADRLHDRAAAGDHRVDGATLSTMM
jgi:hypothetical protein